MYKSLIRPLLFLIKPEKVHHIIVGLIKFLFKIPILPFIISKIFNFQDVKREKELFGLSFRHPIGLAAGFDKDGDFFNEFSAFGFSFIELGTVTPKAQPGNEKPRSFRISKDKGLINRMGFNNKGVDNLVNNLKKRKTNIIIGGNIGKNTATTNENANDDYFYCLEKLYEHVDYFVINISCPNIKDLSKLQNKDSLSVLLKGISEKRNQKKIRKPVLVKISPDLSNNQIDDILELIAENNLDGVVATNTTIKRENLNTDQKVIESIGNGGMSGKPLKERSTQIIEYINKKTEGKLPIIGVGGIFTVDDAIEKLKAGASLIQVYSGFVYEGPAIVKKINKKLLKSGF